MVHRLERVRAHVLDEIADDYEGISQIMIQLRWVAYLGITRDEVKIALVSLVQEGLAQAYDLVSSQEPLPGLPPSSTFEEHYFYITPKGIEILHSFPKNWFPEITGTD
jgi:hypothetical protein